MIITENINVDDSMLFYLCARGALKESIDTSDVEKAEKLKNFIVNEASDYEILSLLLTQKLPEDKLDVAQESLLLSDFKEMVLENFTEISEFVESNTIKDFILEVGALELNKDKLQEAGGVLDRNIGHAGDPKVNPGVVASLWNRVKSGASISQKGLKYVSGAALAALISYGGVKLYKAFISKAERACKGKSGTEKASCLKAYKIKGYQAQMNSLQKGMTSCAKSKDPAKCKKITGQKLVAVKAKLSKLQRS